MSVALKVTIDGADHTQHVLRADAITIERMMGERSVMRLTVIDPEEAYRPERNEEITLEDGAVLLFSGVILRTLERQIEGASFGRMVSVDATDFQLYLDNTVIEHHFLAGETLLTCITDIVAKIGHGVTVHPSQAAGPTMPELFIKGETVTSAFDKLRAISGWAWSIDYQKRVRFVNIANAPAAAWNIDDDSRNFVSMSVARDATQYFNSAGLLCGAGEPISYEDDWVATPGQADFVTSYSAATAPTTVWVDPPVGDGYWAEVGAGKPFTWSDESPQGTGTLHHEGGGLDAGTYVRLPYSAYRTFGVTYSHPVQSQDPPVGVGLFQRRFDHPEITSHAAALALAQAYVETGVADPIAVEYTTYTPGLDLGVQQTIQSTLHGINTSFLIVGLMISSFAEGTELKYDVSAIDVPQFVRTYVERWRVASGSTGSTKISGGGGFVPATVPPTSFPLATSRNEWRQHNVADTYFAVANPIRWRLTDTQFTGRVLTVHAWVRGLTDGTYGITPALRNITDGTICPVAGAMQEHDWSVQDWTFVSFNVTLAAGTKDYELWVKTSLADRDVNATGMLWVV